MTILNPFLLASRDGMEQYQKNRIKEWEKQKGKKSDDFDHYIKQLEKQFEFEGGFTKSTIDPDSFDEFDSITEKSALKVIQQLKSMKG